VNLVQVTERKAGSPSDFPLVRDKVRELASAELMTRVVAQQREAAQVKIQLEDEAPAKPAQAKPRFLFGSR
jgi:hypothetical protein